MLVNLPDPIFSDEDVSMPTTARFGVRIAGHDRCILSVSENSKEELTLSLRENAAPLRVDPPPGISVRQWADDVALRESRYSVHNSDQSLTNINTIKQTRVFKNNNTLTSAFYTPALKQNDQFCWILTKRCSSMLDITYAVRRDKKPFHLLNDYGHDAFPTLIFSIFIGNTNREFVHDPLFDIDFRQFKFARYSIVIMWSYLTIFPQHTRESVHRAAGAPASAYFQREDDCIRIFSATRNILRQSLISLMKSLANNENQRRLCEASIFSKQPVPSPKVFRFWMKMLRYLQIDISEPDLESPLSTAMHSYSPDPQGRDLGTSKRSRFRSKEKS